MIGSCPEVGVRKRPFVVREIVPSAVGDGLEPSSISHLLKLFEDDDSVEESQVIWELEPGTEIYEKSTLAAPTSFDHPKRLQAFLDGVKWGAISQSDDRAFHSPFRTGMDVDGPCGASALNAEALLIADDVGLGKTIEAGLVVEEMILRRSIR